MCGIIAYKGNGNASQILHGGLKRLNYRGYDSWGFCFVTPKGIEVIKDIGDIEKTGRIPSNGNSKMAICHSRWATHGKVTKENAHPHTCCHEKIAVVHNGIIENYQDLKKELTEKGHVFKSETDTEVISHLIEELCNENMFEQAVVKAAKMLRGSYAFVAVHRDSDALVGVKNGSPLVIGVGEGENFLASDVLAFMERTRNVIYMDDGEVVVIK